MNNRSHLSDLSPALASILMIGSLALFFLNPFSSSRLHHLPEGRNGMSYSFGTKTELLHLTIYRDGAMSVGNRSVSADQVFDMLTSARREHDELARLALRIALHPDAPVSAIREVYDIGTQAEIDAIFFRVTRPQTSGLTRRRSQA